MTTIFPEQLNVKFVAPWPEAGGDLYHDGKTGSSFVVHPGDKLTEVLALTRERFKEEVA